MDSAPDGASYHWMPEDWFVVFWRETNIPLARWLAWGEFKHVTACGYVAKANSWLFFDARWKGMIVETIPDDMVDLRLQSWMRGNLIVHVRGRLLGSFPRFGFWCVPLIAHLVGDDCGALRPDGLLASLRRRAIWTRDWNTDEGSRRYGPEEGRGALAAGPG